MMLESCFTFFDPFLDFGSNKFFNEGLHPQRSPKVSLKATVSRVDASPYERKRRAISTTKALPALPDGILNKSPDRLSQYIVHG